MTRGFSVRAKFDVPSARAAIAERRPALIISDLMMPGITGFEFMRELRAEERRESHPRIRSIAISGRGNPADRRRFRVVGFDAFMQKPIKVQELVHWIRSGDAAGAGHGLARKALICGAPGEMTSFLEQRGVEVQCVEDPAQAYDRVRRWGPQLVMADLDVPANLELVSALRPDFADLILGGWAKDHERLEGHEALDFCVAAPVEYTELARVLRL